MASVHSRRTATPARAMSVADQYGLITGSAVAEVIVRMHPGGSFAMPV